MKNHYHIRAATFWSCTLTLGSALSLFSVEATGQQADAFRLTYGQRVEKTKAMHDPSSIEGMDAYELTSIAGERPANYRVLEAFNQQVGAYDELIRLTADDRHEAWMGPEVQKVVTQSGGSRYYDITGALVRKNDDVSLLKRSQDSVIAVLVAADEYEPFTRNPFPTEEDIRIAAANGYQVVRTSGLRYGLNTSSEPITQGPKGWRASTPAYTQLVAADHAIGFDSIAMVVTFTDFDERGEVTRFYARSYARFELPDGGYAYLPRYMVESHVDTTVSGQRFTQSLVDQRVDHRYEKHGQLVFPREKAKSDKLLVYPNPLVSGGQLSIVLPQNLGDDGTITVYDARGVIVKSYSAALLSGATLPVEMFDGLPAGTFVIVLKDQSHSWSSTIILH